MPYPIIDSHIHLSGPVDPSKSRYPNNAALLSSLATPSNFNIATLALPRLRGYIVVEAARTYDLTTGAAGWEEPLKEIEHFRSLVEDPEEGHRVLGIVPWAPVPSGREAVVEYLGLAEERAGPEAWKRVKGFRFLAQDADAGIQVTEGFVEGVKELGKRGFVFEVGVDHHRRGSKQLEETFELISRAHEGVPTEEKVAFVINHLGKPDLHMANFSEKNFLTWSHAIYRLAICEKTYIQMSGLFSEMPASIRGQDSDDIFAAVFRWLTVLKVAFGADRIMFASDWPICVADADGASWVKWKEVVERFCYMVTLSVEDQAKLFAGTAKKVFGLDVQLEDLAEVVAAEEAAKAEE